LPGLWGSAIFQRLTQLIVKTADLFEAEGRMLREVARKEGKDLRKHAANLSLGAAILIAAAPLAFLGVALLLLSIFLGLREPMGNAGAAAITGVVALAIAGVLVLVFRGVTK
jgi:hypothetical protein